MATAKKAAAPAPKAAATKPAAKAATKPAAKATAPAAKPAAKAAAPVQKPAAKAVEAALPTVPVVGTIIEFAGYPENVPVEDRLVPDGTVAAVIEVVAADADNPEAYVIRFDNPNFDESQPEDPESNPPFIETELYEGEFVISADQTPLGTEAAPAETPAAEPIKNGRAKAAAKSTTPVSVEDQPAHDELPELAQEDANVLALVEGAGEVEGGLIGVAQGLEDDIESKNFQLGGILYHIKRDGDYKELDPRYAENGGFALFIADYYKFGYRKAMNLIDIYVSFNQLNIENAAEVVAELGWTKASKLAAAMDEENVNDLIDLARNNTVEGLTEAIKTQKFEVGGTKGDQKTRTTIKLRYFEDEAADIVATLNGVMETQGLKKIEEAFAFVVSEFKMGQGEAAPVAAAPKQAAAAPAATPARAGAKPAARRVTAAA